MTPAQSLSLPPSPSANSTPKRPNAPKLSSVPATPITRVLRETAARIDEIARRVA